MGLRCPQAQKRDIKKYKIYQYGMISWYDFTVDSCDDLWLRWSFENEKFSSLEKFYEAFDHFLEVFVLLNKFCNRSTHIDDLEIESLR